jgi:hypothetical protein
MQVYLPDELYRYVKDNDLPASQLLQSAVEAERERQLKLRELDEYLVELEAEVGPPTLEDEAYAKRLVDRIVGAEDERRTA